MRNILKALVVIGTLATPMIASADTPAKDTSAEKAPAKTHKSKAKVHKTKAKAKSKAKTAPKTEEKAPDSE